MVRVSTAASWFLTRFHLRVKPHRFVCFEIAAKLREGLKGLATGGLHAVTFSLGVAGRPKLRSSRLSDRDNPVEVKAIQGLQYKHWITCNHSWCTSNKQTKYDAVLVISEQSSVSHQWSSVISTKYDYEQARERKLHHLKNQRASFKRSNWRLESQILYYHGSFFSSITDTDTGIGLGYRISRIRLTLRIGNLTQNFNLIPITHPPIKLGNTSWHAHEQMQAKLSGNDVNSWVRWLNTTESKHSDKAFAKIFGAWLLRIQRSTRLSLSQDMTWSRKVNGSNLQAEFSGLCKIAAAMTSCQAWLGIRFWIRLCICIMWCDVCMYMGVVCNWAYAANEM